MAGSSENDPVIVSVTILPGVLSVHECAKFDIYVKLNSDKFLRSVSSQLARLESGTYFAFNCNPQNVFITGADDHGGKWFEDTRGVQADGTPRRYPIFDDEKPHLRKFFDDAVERIKDNSVIKELRDLKKQGWDQF